MPVPFMAGLAIVSKASGAVGVAFATADAVLQVSSVSCFPAERVTTRRTLRRTRAAKDKSQKLCAALQRGVGAIDGRRTLRAFAAGTFCGTIGASAYIVFHGVSTTAVPLTQDTTIQAVSLAGSVMLIWAPVWTGGMLTDDEPEWQLPTHFFSTLITASAAFAIPSMMHYMTDIHSLLQLRDAFMGVAAPLSGMLLALFVNQYAWMQAHKKPPHGRENGPMVETASRWLIISGVVSGNLLSIALIATPWYHPGHFLVWGITNPGLMYTMAIMAEDEIESHQMEAHLTATDARGRLLVDRDAYMRRRLVRAMLPLLGLPFAYVADRDDVRHLVKVLLAGVGAIGLGTIIVTFQDEWHALFKYDYPELEVLDCEGAAAPVESITKQPSTTAFKKPDMHSTDTQEPEAA